MTYRKKLIEVALPLEAINRASAKEKGVRSGHPSTFHLWFARRPLAACRAVLFAQLVDDPSAHPERFPDDKSQAAERQRLFRIIERLVQWENSHDAGLLADAHKEIRRSCGELLPAVYDPFCGGGSIPLEAARLGLVPVAADLNPVPVVITKGLVETPARFANRPPVATRHGQTGMDWSGARGLASDVRHYAEWIDEQARGSLAESYPDAIDESTGAPLKVIAWLWARTITCPNPACAGVMPLLNSFVVCSKKGRETWLEPHVDRAGRSVQFEIRSGKAKGLPCCFHG